MLRLGLARAAALTACLSLQLGGGASLLTVEAHSAMDITPLSIYANEKESLLAPGTQLKVSSRKRNGKVAEIRLVEVGSALD